MIIYIFRTSQQDSSKYTHFKLLYKQEARLPVDITLPMESEKADEVSV